MAYIDQIASLDDGALQARIVMAARHFIDTELPKETQTTPNYTNRKQFGTSFALNAGQYTGALVAQVLASGVITTASTDTDIDAQVAKVWDTLAGGNPIQDLLKIALAAVAVSITQDPTMGGAVTDATLQAKYKSVAQDVFRKLDGYAADAAYSVALQIAGAGKDASNVSLTDMVGYVKALMPSYVSAAPAPTV